MIKNLKKIALPYLIFVLLLLSCSGASIGMTLHNMMPTMTKAVHDSCGMFQGVFSMDHHAPDLILSEVLLLFSFIIAVVFARYIFHALQQYLRQVFCRHIRWRRLVARYIKYDFLRLYTKSLLHTHIW